MKNTGPPASVLAAFGIGVDAPFRRTADGWINDTFLVGSPPNTVVQRISSTYFDDAEGVMENLVRLIGHLEWKRRFGSPEADEDDAVTKPVPRWFPELKNTLAGKPYLFDDDGTIWRALSYIPGRVPTESPSTSTVRNAAEIYGRFLAQIVDLGGPPLRRTIEWYRDLDEIRRRFDAAVDSATAERKSAALPAFEITDQIAERLELRLHALEPGAFRVRPVHNDTKLANVLMFPDSDAMTAVIDLDVAMEGQAAHDFGDLLRSASQAGSDPQRPFDVALFDAVLDGFLAGAGPTLTEAELTALPTAGPRICLELGMRYITDYVNEQPVLWHGDRDVALARGLRNLRLAEGMLDSHDALQAMVADRVQSRNG